MAAQSSNLPQHNNSHPVIVSGERHEIFQGPLPTPEILERYKNADPSFPERIMKMAEAHNEADVTTKNRISLSNLIIPIFGQIFTLLLGLGSIAAGIYLATAGYTGAAIAAIFGGFSPIIIGAFKNLGHNK